MSDAIVIAGVSTGIASGVVVTGAVIRAALHVGSINNAVQRNQEINDEFRLEVKAYWINHDGDHRKILRELRKINGHHRGTGKT